MLDQLLLLATILTQWQCPVAFSEALNLLHWVMRGVLYRHTATAIEMASKVGFLLLLCFLLPRRPLASRGSWCSPGHAALGNAHRIAPAHPQGLQNGPQRGYI